MTKIFSEADLADTVRLIGSFAGPGQQEIVDRRRTLAEGLRRLVDADVYFWVIGVANSENPSVAMPTSSVDGGWQNDELSNVLNLSVHSPEIQSLYGELTRFVRDNTPKTVLRRDLVTDDAWRAIGKPVRQAGFDELMFSVYPLTTVGHSTIGLHRRFGRPPYTERERLLVHSVFQNIDWIHSPGPQVDAGLTSTGLTPRQREVLLWLLRGHSRKKIAAILTIQPDTVGDFMKEIYRRFDVQSRGELMARFISGEGGI